VNRAIFVSYRRKESLAPARAVYERLRSEFGSERVFIDLEGLDYGVDFVEVLEQQLAHCTVMLALIGPHWLGVDSDGSRRIDDENDFVRIELRTALERKIRVVPVLVEGAAMPASRDLPDELKALVRRQALELDFRRFDSDVGRLIGTLRKILEAPELDATPAVPAYRVATDSRNAAGRPAVSPTPERPELPRVPAAPKEELVSADEVNGSVGSVLTGNPATDLNAKQADARPHRVDSGVKRNLSSVAVAMLVGVGGLVALGFAIGLRGGGQSPASAGISTSPTSTVPTTGGTQTTTADVKVPVPATDGSGLLVRIGHVAPTSGGIAHLGKDNENGARMAIDELNAKGVTIGGKKAKFELVAEDDAADPKRGVAVARVLVDAKVNGVIGHLNSGTSIPASKIYSDAGIPQISPSATNPRYTRQGFKTTFRLVADDVQLGGTLGRYAVKELKGRSIVTIDDRTAYGQTSAEAFAEGVTASGGAIHDTQFTTDKATDFTAVLTAVKAKKPDVIFFGGMDDVAGPMIRQMKQFGINAKFMSADGICSSELPKLAGGAMADRQVVCAEAGGFEGSQNVGTEKFREDFKKKFGTDVQLYAPYVYDAVNVMVAAMVKAGSADPAEYLPVLAKTEGYKGVTGTISFDEKGNLRNGAITLYTYAAGQRYQLAVIR